MSKQNASSKSKVPAQDSSAVETLSKSVLFPTTEKKPRSVGKKSKSVPVEEVEEETTTGEEELDRESAKWVSTPSSKSSKISSRPGKKSKNTVVEFAVSFGESEIKYNSEEEPISVSVPIQFASEKGPTAIGFSFENVSLRSIRKSDFTKKDGTGKFSQMSGNVSMYDTEETASEKQKTTVERMETIRDACVRFVQKEECTPENWKMQAALEKFYANAVFRNDSGLPYLNFQVEKNCKISYTNPELGLETVLKPADFNRRFPDGAKIDVVVNIVDLFIKDEFVKINMIVREFRVMHALASRPKKEVPEVTVF